MKTLYNNYISNFKGLSKEIWWLALISLINRAGTMVIPFLSKYLKESLEFSISDAGTILMFFGIGSLIGSWLGGKLTDKIGFYKVMFYSLLLTGIGFIVLQYITSFWGLCIGILVLMSVADTFRPALFVSLKTYSKPENQTRSLTLLRLAINLGMAFGPMIAGFIISLDGYSLLFWIDGITCILAILLFKYLINETVTNVTDAEKAIKKQNKNAAIKDKSFLIFFVISFLIALSFFQLITSIPIYHYDEFCLTEFQTGVIMFINGALIVIFEMPLIALLETKSISHVKLILISAILFALSYFVLLFNIWVGILVVNIILLTFAEMIGFPYTNAFALNRAKKGSEGSYMALYTMTFALAFIVGPKIGMDIIDNYGYRINWIITGSYSLLAVILSIWLQKRIKNNL
ncbi:MDR family MFS transporter [Winogradskyella endarachnes]|uniref:MFS transporter n=1 Tax=Winogradskyella endarachnes TaxID=2681965 RepID=A0A6L6U7F3_9FLAO|nr:MFS transporter [Winogradskyella endarachnes]MUU78078.1 MFS transporter [Winogradskyella endarachnes]